MKLKTYPSWREEKAAVEEALDRLLPTLAYPHLVRALTPKLSPLVGLPEGRCGRILGWLADEGHAHATHDGGAVRVFGRTGTLWRWHAKAQRVLPAEGLEARLNAAGVVDTSEW